MSSIYGNDLDLEVEKIVSDTLLYAKQNDICALTELLNATEKDYDTHLTGTFITTLLTCDYIELALAVLELDVVNDWIEENIGRVIDSCPNVFEHWIKPRDSKAIICLGKLLRHLDSDKKIALLRGESTSKEHVFLYENIKKNPNFWSVLPVSWAGPRNSQLRQAATDLGWTPNSLIGMSSGFLNLQDSDAWCSAVKYPYSLAMAIMWDKYGNTGGWDSTPMNTERSENVLSVDIALAIMISEKMASVVIYKKPTTQKLDAEQLACLSNMLNMHVSLDAVDLLVQSLANDCIPGYDVDNEVLLELPNIDCSTVQ